jgi:ankyrin repeat protein
MKKMNFLVAGLMLLAASRLSAQNLVSTALQGQDELKKMALGQQLLDYAEHQDWAKALEILDRRTDIVLDLRDTNGDTALTLATLFSNNNAATKLAKTLIDRNADPNTRGWEGSTALMHVACDGNLGLAEDLLDHQAQLDIRGDDGSSALSYAASCGDNGAIVRLLLERGASINFQNTKTGDTALMLAAANGYKDSVRALLDYQAQTGLRNKLGETAADQARNSGWNKIASLIGK